MTEIDTRDTNDFIHQLTEALTTIDGWAQLSLMSLPQNEPERVKIEHLRRVVQNTMIRVHGFMDSH
ncbi:MAG: hypothetical protein ETSY1_33370 [Candidatus Entotheonella factor]|uniref:Uncharacterized protein n=1 Tax=Entotheonella factor TaxID=1429438 RepID=W4L9Q6_ENTF1|nr:MAG: hypothetical protein ETSY1_33370 [Candidatus Entotheonella factor]